ncbi:MAG: hypothetical protein ACREBA_07590 [Nitrosotalea sp.]
MVLNLGLVCNDAVYQAYLGVNLRGVFAYNDIVTYLGTIIYL